MIRTEKTVNTIMTSPERYDSIKKIQATVYSLWQDYQILGLIADNSPIPIEPLTSYGRILKNARLLAAKGDQIKKMADDILGWKNTADTESIFPILDTLWNIGEDVRENAETLAIALFKINPPDQYTQEKYTQYL